MKQASKHPDVVPYAMDPARKKQDREQVEAHLKTCGECRDLVLFVRKTNTSLQRARRQLRVANLLDITETELEAEIRAEAKAPEDTAPQSSLPITSDLTQVTGGEQVDTHPTVDQRSSLRLEGDTSNTAISEDTLLKGGDVPRWRRTFRIKVLDIRHWTPGSSSELVIFDIEKKFGKTAWGAGWFDRKRMTKLFGMHDPYVFIGKELRLDLHEGHDPQQGTPVSWLRLSRKQKKI